MEAGKFPLPLLRMVLRINMSKTHPVSAKILQHSQGLGAPTAETVEKRAEELALIRGVGEFTKEDWQQAKRELHGGGEGHGGEEDAESTAFVSERDMIASDTGHHVPNMGMEDTANVGEELIAEGMDEAIHEQMLEARLADPGDDEEA